MKAKIATSSVRIEDTVLRRVKVYVAKNGITIAEYVSGLLNKEMDKADKKELKLNSSKK